jgi:uncharacterized membrane protein YsdA (DUF1294 family)
MVKVFCYYLIAVNIIAFFAYGVDKWKAKRHRWRIPEATLLVLAAIGGSVGAWIGMQVFRHKTKHLKFVAGVPAIFIIQCIIFMMYKYYGR